MLHQLIISFHTLCASCCPLHNLKRVLWRAEVASRKGGSRFVPCSAMFWPEPLLFLHLLPSSLTLYATHLPAPCLVNLVSLHWFCVQQCHVFDISVFPVFGSRHCADTCQNFISSEKNIISLLFISRHNNTSIRSKKSGNFPCCNVILQLVVRV